MPTKTFADVRAIMSGLIQDAAGNLIVDTGIVISHGKVFKP